MTQYALLIYGSESGAIREATPAEIEPWTKLGEAMEQAGVMRGGTQLHRTSTAQSVRERGGEVLTTTGPFAETTEQLGGVYLLDCASMEGGARVGGTGARGHLRHHRGAADRGVGPRIEPDAVRTPDLRRRQRYPRGGHGRRPGTLACPQRGDGRGRRDAAAQRRAARDNARSAQHPSPATAGS